VRYGARWAVGTKRRNRICPVCLFGNTHTSEFNRQGRESEPFGSNLELVGTDTAASEVVAEPATRAAAAAAGPVAAVVVTATGPVVDLEAFLAHGLLHFSHANIGAFHVCIAFYFSSGFFAPVATLGCFCQLVVLLVFLPSVSSLPSCSHSSYSQHLLPFSICLSVGLDRVR
jgi:hypothetical protein